MTFRLTREASQDLIDIADFLVREYPNIATDVEHRFLSLFNLIEAFPEIGRRGPRPGTRELPVKNIPM